MPIRPLNILTDTKDVIELLNLVFSIQAPSSPQLKRVALSHDPLYQLWSRELFGGRPVGLVWEEENRIIGNISIFPAPNTPTRFIIANVAVHPDFRRRGIGAKLMLAAETFAQKYDGSTLALQVRPTNKNAINLYHNLGYITVGELAVWRIHSRKILKLTHSHLLNIHPLSPKRAREAYQLNLNGFPPKLNWPDPLTPAFYNQTFLSQLKNKLSFKQMHHWGYFDENKLSALLSIHSHWNTPYDFTLRIPPTTESIKLTYPLLIHGMNILTHFPPKSARLQYPPTPELDKILSSLNWSHYRTLTIMLKSLT